MRAEGCRGRRGSRAFLASPAKRETPARKETSDSLEVPGPSDPRGPPVLWALRARRRTLLMMQNEKDIYEYYHPETGQAPPKAASIFGWSSALFIEMALEETRAAR